MNADKTRWRQRLCSKLRSVRIVSSVCVHRAAPVFRPAPRESRAFSLEPAGRSSHAEFIGFSSSVMRRLSSGGTARSHIMNRQRLVPVRPLLPNTQTEQRSPYRHAQESAHGQGPRWLHRHPPEEEDPKYISCNLTITINDKAHTTGWTDGSKGMPDGLMQIVNEIKKVSSNEGLV